MRENLFKGISIKAGEWVEGDLMRSGGGRSYICEQPRLHMDTGVIDMSDMTLVDPSTVSQFTGLLKVFAGDKVDVTIGDYYSNESFTTEGDCTVSGTVVFNSFMWCVSMPDHTWIPFCDILCDGMDITVTGSIHNKDSK